MLYDVVGRHMMSFDVVLEKDFSTPIFISLEMNLPPPFHHHLYLEKDLGPAAPLILEKYFPHPLILEK